MTLDGTLRVPRRLHAMEVATHDSPDVDHERLSKTAIRQDAKLVKWIEEGNSDDAETYWHRHLEAVATVMLKQPGAPTVIELFSHVADASWLPR
jgi:DNA-binding FadR family transcriptional regulator